MGRAARSRRPPSCRNTPAGSRLGVRPGRNGRGCLHPPSRGDGASLQNTGGCLSAAPTPPAAPMTSVLGERGSPPSPLFPQQEAARGPRARPWGRPGSPQTGADVSGVLWDVRPGPRAASSALEYLDFVDGRQGGCHVGLEVSIVYPGLAESPGRWVVLPVVVPVPFAVCPEAVQVHLRGRGAKVRPGQPGNRWDLEGREPTGMAEPITAIPRL